MDQSAPALRTIRWGIFLLTASFFAFKLFTANWEFFGAHFRFLTIWALTFSALSSWFMLQLSMGWTTARREVFASVTVVLNLTVVLMYWKIYFEDPSLFYGADGQPGPWYEEYFLRALGPALQVFDALFLLGTFSRIKPIAVSVTALPIAYLIWIEFVIRPLNDGPVGSVTTGLPYLFLNNMDVSGRAMFYLTTTITMLVLMLIAWALAALIRKIRPAPLATSQ